MTAAAVATVRAHETPGNRRWGIFDFTPSTSYPSNGEPMTASLFGFQKVDFVVPLGAPLASAAQVWVYDSGHNMIRGYVCTTGAEVSGDQSGSAQRILVVGL